MTLYNLCNFRIWGFVSVLEKLYFSFAHTQHSHTRYVCFPYVQQIWVSVPGCQLEIPMNPSYSSMNLLEWFTELTNILLIRLPVYYKKMWLKTSQRKEMHRVRHVGKGYGASMVSPGVLPPHPLCMFTNPEAPQIHTAWSLFMSLNHLGLISY